MLGREVRDAVPCVRTVSHPEDSAARVAREVDGTGNTGREDGYCRYDHGRREAESRVRGERTRGARGHVDRARCARRTLNVAAGKTRLGTPAELAMSW